MEAFVKRQKRKISPAPASETGGDGDEEGTEVMLAMLSSLHPQLDPETLLNVLLAHDGSLSEASAALQVRAPKKPSGGIGPQQSLRAYGIPGGAPAVGSNKRHRSKKGTTLRLYDPEDVAEHTPCTIIHNFLPPELASSLLSEMLEESRSFEKITFKLFENTVTSPHTSCFYVQSLEEAQSQKTDYYYNGSKLSDVRRITPQLLRVQPAVQAAVNQEIQHRIRTRYPGGRKLKYQSPQTWAPNAAFVNCYDGARQSVGWHSDQLTYLGPRAVIGSISLGVAREFRVRRIIPQDGKDGAAEDADAEGSISIHLPHNSLLVMHAEMQEEWKHCIAPALSIDPHPIAGNRRINITYRDYRQSMHPRFTPKCSCGVPCVLRAVQKKRKTFGRYFWMCHAGNVPGQQGCSTFEWAEFDDDGNPLLVKPRAVESRTEVAACDEMPC